MRSFTTISGKTVKIFVVGILDLIRVAVPSGLVRLSRLNMNWIKSNCQLP